MSLVAEVAVLSTLAFHWRGVGVGLAEEEVRLARRWKSPFTSLSWRPALEIQSLLAALAVMSSSSLEYGL